MTTTEPTRGWVLGDTLMTAAEVADALRTTKRTVADLRRRGQLPGVLVGNTFHFTPDDVRAFIAAQRSEQRAAADHDAD